MEIHTNRPQTPKQVMTNNFHYTPKASTTGQSLLKRNDKQQQSQKKQNKLEPVDIIVLDD